MVMIKMEMTRDLMKGSEKLANKGFTKSIELPDCINPSAALSNPKYREIVSTSLKSSGINVPDRYLNNTQIKLTKI